MSYDFIKQVFCHQIGRKSSGDRATIVEFSAIGVGQRLGLICEKRPDRSGIRSRTRAPLFPFPDRLSSVFSALGEKANS
jgi:hypothetical protein